VNSLVEEFIPKLVTDQSNNILTILPSEAEIDMTVFSLNKKSTPNLDGFDAIFFQSYWNTVMIEVINAVQEFFATGKMLNNFNSNTIVLILKINNAYTINQFRHIALANFKYKIISKILADKLAILMPHIISKSKWVFIKVRNIKDFILLTSEAVNLLNKKISRDNVVFKIDIAKTYDTLICHFF